MLDSGHENMSTATDGGETEEKLPGPDIGG
jgi:hypothetical protein